MKLTQPTRVLEMINDILIKVGAAYVGALTMVAIVLAVF